MASAAQVETKRRPTARAEHVGSLVRPKALLEAQQRVTAAIGVGTEDANVLMAKGAAFDEELAQLQDDLIRDAVARQLAAGLDVVTDGEFRRCSSRVRSTPLSGGSSRARRRST
jgi:5-methyltetrahydropteroyltriglutamate--homocysteine methyltransferase